MDSRLCHLRAPAMGWAGGGGGRNWLYSRQQTALTSHTSTTWYALAQLGWSGGKNHSRQLPSLQTQARPWLLLPLPLNHFSWTHGPLHPDVPQLRPAPGIPPPQMAIPSPKAFSPETGTQSWPPLSHLPRVHGLSQLQPHCHLPPSLISASRSATETL